MINVYDDDDLVYIAIIHVEYRLVNCCFEMNVVIIMLENIFKGFFI